jgi:hypothetical protein
MTNREDCSTPVPAPAADGRAPGAPPADGPANPAALTVEQLAKMLAVPVETVRDHVAAGAPTGLDGTINLVHYAAWRNRRLKELDGD